MQALWYLMRYTAVVPARGRLHLDALTLGAAAVYLFNSLNSRPGEYRWDRQLTEVVFPTKTMSDCDVTDIRRNLAWVNWRSPNVPIPLMTRGALWFGKISYPSKAKRTNNLRFEWGIMTATPELLCKLYSKKKWAELEAMFNPSKALNKFSSGELTRRNTKKSANIPVRPALIPDGLTDSLMPSPTPFYDHAPDLPADAVEGEIPTGDVETIGQRVLNTASQVYQRIGTRINHQSYQRLSASEKLNLSFETFRHMNLSSYFDDYQYRRNDADWRRITDLLFPAQGADLGYTRNQGWRAMPAMDSFLEIRSRLIEEDPMSYSRVRRACVDVFNTFKWFPSVIRDRAFVSKWNAGSSWVSIYVGNQRPKLGVVILLNPLFHDPVTTDRTLPPVLDRRAHDEDRDEQEAQRERMRAHNQDIPGIYTAIREQYNEDVQMEADLLPPVTSLERRVAALAALHSSSQIRGRVTTEMSAISRRLEAEESEEEEDGTPAGTE